MMTIREQLEERELEYLSPYASFSRESRGRERPEQECDIRRCFSVTGTGSCTARRSGG